MSMRVNMIEIEKADSILFIIIYNYLDAQNWRAY